MLNNMFYRGTAIINGIMCKGVAINTPFFYYYKFKELKGGDNMTQTDQPKYVIRVKGSEYPFRTNEVRENNGFIEFETAEFVSRSGKLIPGRKVRYNASEVISIEEILTTVNNDDETEPPLM